MKPIQANEKKLLKQKVIEEMKRYILEEELTAGDKLPTERAFTEMFGVSRSVVREALSYLENVGILRIRQGQGAFLQKSNIENLLESFFFLWQINHANIRDILGIRVIFECSAVDEILKQNDRQMLERLKQQVSDMEETEDIREWRQADIDFHQQLLQATNNELFIQMTSMITTYFFQIQYIELTLEEYQQLTKEHQAIVAAIENQDALLAKSLLTKHINQAKA